MLQTALMIPMAYVFKVPDGNEMRSVIILIFIAFTSFTPAMALAKDCSIQDARQAEAEVSTLADWDGVYTSYLHFSHCNDGAISEGYSETVGRLLAKDWEHFGRLYELTRRNKKFERFIIRHIDETVPSDYLQAIIENTKLHCPANKKRFCHAIEAAAK